MQNAVINGNIKLDYAGSEAINTICSNLMFSGVNVRKIVVTSCEPNDGKTFVAMQVAANMARRGKKALLIDADLRMSVLNAQYDIQLQGSGAGLAHLLSGQCTLEDALYETSQPNLFLIPAGTDVQSPLSLIDTPDFVRMTEAVGESFDLVVIDTPPIGMVIDAAEIARCCDGSILVLEYAKTHLKALQGAKQQMEKTGTPILGCVLNKVAMDRLSTRKYYSYGGKYGYRKYGRYGNKSYYRRDGKENKAENN